MSTSTFSADRQAFRETLATLATKTLTKIPALNGRVEKAVKLALAGDVELHDDGTATVYSSSAPTRRYEIRQGTCTCRDYEQAPEHLCQHRLSAGLVRKVQELLPAEPAPEVLGAGTNNQPLYEAPCSVNCHVTISGRQVQVTLRGQDEQEVLARLEAVLQRYPQPQPAPQASSQGQLSPQQHNALAMGKQVTGVCPIHGVQMQENEKQGRRWWSHRTDQGWCKGK
jgi:hypothetical protein